MNLRLHLREFEKSFDMKKAVCNHGFFMMAPNLWEHSTLSLQRPLMLSNSSSVNVRISHPKPLSFLVIEVPEINNVSRIDEELILQQVTRMFRLSTKDQHDINDFQKIHQVAKEKGFGRLFRSPSLFEDIVKTLLLCNSTWGKTLQMVERLCELQLKLANGTVRPPGSKKRKQEYKKTGGNFPSAKEIASLDIKLINEHCKLGYRAKHILNIAEMIENGSLNLEELESEEVEQMVPKLKKIRGVGDFVTSTVLMCIGYYHIIPSDTETLRLLREVHKIEECSKKTVQKTVQELYHKFSPFQTLAYWLDLVQNYESKVGELSMLDRNKYGTVGGCLTKETQN